MAFKGNYSIGNKRKMAKSNKRPVLVGMFDYAACNSNLAQHGGRLEGGTMEDESIKTKTECGLVYYDDNGKWKIAGREGHPLTKKYLEVLQGKDVCRCCKE